MLLGCTADHIGKPVRLLSRLRECQIHQHAVIVFSFQLLFAHKHSCPGIGQSIRLIPVKIKVSVLRFFAHIKQNVNERNPIFRYSADELVIGLVVDSVSGIQKLRRFIIQLHQLGEFARSKFVRQLVSVQGIGIGDCRNGVHLIESFQITDQLLLFAVISSGHNNSHHSSGRKCLVDHFFRYLHIVESGGHKGIITVNVGAAAGKGHGTYCQKQKHRWDQESGGISKVAYKRDFGHKAFVFCLFHKAAHEHQQPRHHRKHSQQREKDCFY